MQCTKEMPVASNGPKVATPPARGVKPAVAPAPMREPPLAMMHRFAEEIDRVFEDFGLSLGVRLPAFLSRGHELLRRETGLVPAFWSPRVDVLEMKGQFIVRVDLPGVTLDQVKVATTDDMLTIQGERRQTKAQEQEGYRYNECRHGSFYRMIPLPAGADPTKTTATFANGVLEVVMPVPEHEPPKARAVEIHGTK